MPWVLPSPPGNWRAEGIQSLGRGAQKVDGRWKCAGAVLGHSMDEHIAEYTSMESFKDDTNDQYAIYNGGWRGAFSAH